MKSAEEIRSVRLNLYFSVLEIKKVAAFEFDYFSFCQMTGFVAFSHRHNEYSNIAANFKYFKLPCAFNFTFANLYVYFELSIRGINAGKGLRGLTNGESG